MRWIVLVALGGAAVVAGAIGLHTLGGAPAPVLPGIVPACGPAPSGPPHAGMVWVPGGIFTMGSDTSLPEEGPSRTVAMQGFWMDQTEVTNGQFAEFVAATGYRTLAERGIRIDDRPDAPVVAGSSVFRPHAGDTEYAPPNWWQFVPGADWRQPEGPGSSIRGRGQHPVVHIAYEDALAYARWKGRSLPSEAQFEFAAQGSERRRADGSWAANTWQGSFPARDLGSDGHAGTAPVACYPANRLGLYDMVGNVWEWTSTPYYAGHDAADSVLHPRGFDPAQPEETAVTVLKGGSYLCAPDYCMRYRPEARIGQVPGLGAAHIGFRTVLNPSPDIRSDTPP